MSEAVFQQLAPFVRELIYTAGWEELRPIQVAAIQAILGGTDDVLITAATASGKTEAAFLPILSIIHAEALGSVRALYIGPLKALINDQFHRLELLCAKAEIPVHRWHGDVTQHAKNRLLSSPGGVLQITPESLESLLINKQDRLRRLFGGLRFIVIDEVHTFLESDRGLQLQSQLARLATYCTPQHPRRIGLSATVGDLDAAARWLNPTQPQAVHTINVSGVGSRMLLSHLHFPEAKDTLPPQLVDDLYRLTYNRKTLIFCNTRQTVEELTLALNQRCIEDRVEERYLAHHGSVSKNLREEAEHRMQNFHHPASVVCTMTLELGIDIGQLDLVVQLNSTPTVMSLIQRLGRSGRRPGAPRIMQLYTTAESTHQDDPIYLRLPWSLLKAIAVTTLLQEGWVEPPHQRTKAYNVLYHQILSYLTQHHGSSARNLVGFFLNSRMFSGVKPESYAVLINHLAKQDHIQQLPTGELILGLEGEKVVRSRDFYAVFQTPPEWSVVHGTVVLGRVAPSPDLIPGVCLLLVGRRWEVQQVLPNEHLVVVAPGPHADRVMFETTEGVAMHARIAERVQELLRSNTIPDYLNEAGQNALQDARVLAQTAGILQPIMLENQDEWAILPWAGTRVGSTIILILQSQGWQAFFPKGCDPWIILISKRSQQRELRTEIKTLCSSSFTAQDLIAALPRPFLERHKFDEALPESLLQDQMLEEFIDWEGAHAVLNRL